MPDRANLGSDEDGRPVTEHVSRRTVMKIGAGAGIVAATTGATGIAFASPGTGDGADSVTANGPIVAHVSDFAAGTVELYTGGTRRQITDHDLARRIARAARS